MNKKTWADCMYICISQEKIKKIGSTGDRHTSIDKQQFRYFLKNIGGPEKGRLLEIKSCTETFYLLLVYLVTALVPSLTACLANSPGNKRRTAVWISRDVMVDLLL